MTEKTKTVHCLRIREADTDTWSEVEYFESKRERDETEQMTRIIGGMRTHSFSEKKTAKELAEIFG